MNIRNAMCGYALSCLEGIVYDEIPAQAAVPADVNAGRPAQPAVAHRPALTSAQILDLYESKFVTAANTAYARQQFLNAIQGKDEDITHWHTRLITLYRRSDPTASVENSRELVERFAKGLLQPAVREKVYGATGCTMSRALEVAVNRAAVVAMMHEDEMERTGGRRKQIPGLFAMDQAQERAGGSDRKSNIKCWACDQEGHFKSECPNLNKRKQGDKSGPNKGGNGGNRKGGYGNNRRIAALDVEEEVYDDEAVEDDQESEN